MSNGDAREWLRHAEADLRYAGFASAIETCGVILALVTPLTSDAV